jgi:cytochrome c biogenesis protein CcmG/thiol:disulfide interchange protein DsbE
VRVPLLLFSLLLLPLVGCDRGTTPKLIGKPAPDFTVNDNVQTLQLSKYRGHTVVLNFWATWCPPCVEETPSLIEMQHQLKDKVVLVAISTDTDSDAYHAFLQKNGVDFLTVRDGDNKSNRLYGTVMFPETYIIDSQGIVRRKFIGAVDWTKPEILDYLRKIG